MTEAVLNWDRVIHKNVRSSDRVDVGNIIQIGSDTLTIMQGATRLYTVPKSHVEGFNGSEVFLDIPFDELKNYKTT
jgi:hypothetical protein